MLERIGFRREGVLRGLAFIGGRWRDRVLYAQLRGELTGSGDWLQDIAGPTLALDLRELRLLQRSGACRPRLHGAAGGAWR